MESSKIKQIVILILVIVNGFLLILVAGRAWTTAQAQETAREQVVNILGENGIEMDDVMLPDEVELPGAQVARDSELEVMGAKALLGEDAQLDEDTMTYQGSKGTARFYVDGEFYVQFTSGSYPLDEGADQGDVALALLESMGFSGQVVEGTDQEVVVEQLIEDVPVFSCQATVLFSDQEVVGIASGSRRLVGTPQMDVARELITVPMALLKLLDYVKVNGDLCSEIYEMTLGYVLDTQSVPAVLYPTWEITAQVGADLGTYTVDAESGAVKS